MEGKNEEIFSAKTPFKYSFQRVAVFASIAFGYPNAVCLGRTQTPANPSDSYSQDKEPYM